MSSSVTGGAIVDAASVNAAGAVMESDIAAGCIRGRKGQSPYDYYNIAGVDGSVLIGNSDAEWAIANAATLRAVLNVEDAADVTDATNVNSAGAVMESDIAAGCIRGRHGQSPFAYYNITGTTDTFLMGNADTEWSTAGAGTARSVLNVADGADVTASNPPQSHAHAYHTNRPREIFLTDWYHRIGAADFDYGLNFATGIQSTVSYGFKIPRDFVSINSVYVYYYMSATGGNVLLTVSSLYATTAQAHNTHFESDASNIVAVPNTNLSRFHTVGLMGNASFSDLGRIQVFRDGTHANDTAGGNMYVKGVMIEYTADM